MDISTMHTTFRQYAQQMGMQNVRNILPEQVDIILNTAQTDVLNQVIRENVGVGGDNSTNTNKLYEVNVLKPLIKTESRTITNNVFTIPSDVYFLIGVTADIYNENKETYTENDKYTEECTVRIINVARLGETLHDVILKPKHFSPIACLKEQGTMNVYCGVNSYNDKKANIKELYVHYIKTPQKVKLAIKPSEVNVNCEMDESLHEIIVRRATELYLASIRRSPVEGQQNQVQQ